MEEIYIGTKIIAAEEMDHRMFIESVKGQPWPDQEDEPGYKVRYEDGYVSWSPKSAFERAYRKVTLQEAEMVSSGQFVIPDSSGIDG